MQLPIDEAERRLALQTEFPILQNAIYLNHAAVSPWPTRVRHAVEQFAAGNNLNGPAGFPQWLANEQSLHERYARILNAEHVRDIGLVPNTTEGIVIVARGFPWKSGDNLVTVKDEFPSNQMAWRALEALGVTIRVVDIRQADDPEAALLHAMDERTRMLVVSAVQWSDGFRLQLGRLGKPCRQAGVLFFVDAIQQLGALRIDVQKEYIDCLTAGSHKWQMAPEGLGVFYCRHAWQDTIKPLKPGWRMLDEPYAFDKPGRPVNDSARRYEPGTPNTIVQFALNAALSLQEDWGQDWIESRVLGNARRLMTGLGSIRGCDVVSRQETERASGIVSFLPGTAVPRSVVTALGKLGVVAIARGDWVRFSPHCYLGNEAMDTALNRLEQVLQRS